MAALGGPNRVVEGVYDRAASSGALALSWHQMSTKRQTASRARNDEHGADEPPIRSFAVQYADGTVLEPHRHDWDQLVFASRGVMNVRTERGVWVVPTQRAVWVPAGVEHGIEMSGVVAMRTLYFQRGVPRAMPAECCVVHVSPLARELILHVTRLGVLDARVPEQARLIGVLVDQLEGMTAQPLRLPLPTDARARRVADLLIAHPDRSESLEVIARGSHRPYGIGASKRTLERLFVAETQMTFGRWRQQLRLLHALRLLAAGQPVTNVALDVGYESPSAFIAMFKRALGKTPSRYFEG